MKHPSTAADRNISNTASGSFDAAVKAFACGVVPQALVWSTPRSIPRSFEMTVAPIIIPTVLTAPEPDLFRISLFFIGRTSLFPRNIGDP